MPWYKWLKKSHEKREQWEECPHCGKPLQWIYVESEWLPCDMEPVMFYPGKGKANVVHHRKITENCLIYNPNLKMPEEKPLYGLQQHYYTCETLKKARKEYALSKLLERI